MFIRFVRIRDERPMTMQPKILRARWLIIMAAAAASAGFVAANAHLIFVAVSSDPGCVAHIRDPGTKPGEYRAARSSC
jgi:hypothetical protein